MIKSSSVSNYIQRDGFVMVSNLLISCQEELDITNRELTFLIKVMKHKENYKLHDKQLDPTVSPRTLQRCRKDLTEKGLITYKVWKYTDEKGHIHTEGITYDLSQLEEKLQQISNKIAEAKDIEATKEAKEYLIEYEEDSPIVEYVNEWENHYGDRYKISQLEKDWYNNLSKDEQEYIGRVFEYCENYRLFKEITPRLALFMKNKYRFDQLKSFCEDNPKEKIYQVDFVEEEDDIYTRIGLSLKEKNKDN